MGAWPETLPKSFLQDSFYEELPDLDIVTQMDAGPPKSRRRTTAAEYPLGGQMSVSEAQWNILRNFYLQNTRSLPFDFIHPLTEEVLTVKFDKPPRRAFRVPGRYNVNIDFKVQP